MNGTPLRASRGVQRRLALCMSLLVLAGAACGDREASSGLIGYRTGANLELYVNELMPSNSDTFADEAGEFDDWFELLNLGENDVELGGFFVSDDETSPRKGALPDGLVVPAGGVLVLWADGSPQQGDHHLGFRLSAAGEGLWLSDGGGELIDGVRFGAPGESQSLQRFPDGTGEPEWCSLPSPGELNGDGCAAAAPSG